MTFRAAVKRMVVGVDRAVYGRMVKWRRKNVLFDLRSAGHFTCLAPVIDGVTKWKDVRTYFTVSRRGQYKVSIAPVIRSFGLSQLVRASNDSLRYRRFDLAVYGDFNGALPKRPCTKIQVFHGIGAKAHPRFYSREWFTRYDYLFAIGPTRKQLLRDILGGAERPRVLDVGMPRADQLVRCNRPGPRNAQKTVLFAPTWTERSILKTDGAEILRALSNLPHRVRVKLHDKSAGIWRRVDPDKLALVARFNARGNLAVVKDPSPVAAVNESDVLVTDVGSIGFEYLLTGKPIVLFLNAQSEGHYLRRSFVDDLASVSYVVTSADQLSGAVAAALEESPARQEERRKKAGDYFYNIGRATGAALATIRRILDNEA